MRIRRHRRSGTSARYVRSIAVILLVITACDGGAASDPSGSATTTTASSVTGPPASPLEGDWVSDSIAAADIRAVVLDAGFTRKDAEEVLGETSSFEFSLRFEGGRFALLSSWDGEDAGELESGPYQLVEDDRLRLGIGDTGDSLLFAFDLRGEELTLRLLRNAEAGTAEDKYTHSYFTTAFYTGHPFTRSA